MGFRAVNVRIEGASPLLMQSATLVNPRHEMTKAMKAITKKKTGKTETDLEELMRIEWFANIYTNGAGRVVLPDDNIEGCIIEGAKKSKSGKDCKAGVYSDSQDNCGFVLEYEGPKDVEKLYEDNRFVDLRAVRVNAARVMRCRPIFRKWACDFRVQFNEDVLSLGDLQDWVNSAGSLCGVGTFRPKFGRFTVAKFEGE